MPGWYEPEPIHVTGTALAHCILGKYVGVVCHCFPPPLDVPTFAARCLYVRKDARDPSRERWNCGRERCPVIFPKFRLPRKFRHLLHAANLRHVTDGVTSPPKQGVLRIFRPKITTASDGFLTRELWYQRPARYPQTTEVDDTAFHCIILYIIVLIPAAHFHLNLVKFLKISNFFCSSFYYVDY